MLNSSNASKKARSSKWLTLLMTLSSLLICSLASSANHTSEQELIYLNGERLELAKQQIKAQNPFYVEAYDKLITLAMRELEREIDPVTHKTILPASGDIHDYHTLGSYYWPDTRKEDGLPWIYKDGEFNPINRGPETDWTRLREMFTSLHTLNLAYYFSGEEVYLHKAHHIVRVWFIEEKTKVNPNVNYGKAIPGKVSGTNFAIIDWTDIGKVITTIQLLDEGGMWSARDKSIMNKWLEDYYTWLTESEFGIRESTRTNNHGTNYDYQLIGLMIYLGKLSEAEVKLEEVKETRIASQINPDGSQPRELARTKSVNYTVNNLWALARMADLAYRFTEIDLWHYQSEDGVSLKKAFEFVIPFLTGKKTWEWKQITGGGADSQLVNMALPMLHRSELMLGVNILPIGFLGHEKFTPQEILMYAPETKGSDPNWGNARWIWQAEEGPANTWVAFRKTFDLEELPMSAMAKIAVDTKYWLWVNGERVLFEGGLARGAGPGTTYFDLVDIASFLTEGQNTIAVLVWYWGRTRKVHDDSGWGGLIVHADLGEKALITDSSWKLTLHPAYDPASGGGGKSANRVNAYNVYFDGRKALGDWSDHAWYLPGYDDSSWGLPTEKGCANANPWGRLVERSIPRWNDRGLADYGSLKLDNQAIELPFFNMSDSVREIHAFLPFNQQVTPFLKANCEAGQILTIDTDNPFNLLEAKYTTRKGVQSFESYSWFNGHEVIYHIPPGVEILELKYRWTGLGEMTGSFEVSDSFYTRLWWMARNTLYICARDGFMDCPDRERGLWIGDVGDQTGAVFYTLDEAGRLLLKKAIDNTIAYRDGDTLQGLAPGFGAYRGKSSELTCQSLQFIDHVVWQYYYHTGDTVTLAHAYPAIFRYLNLWKMMPDGLPEPRQGYANWVDWGADPDPEPVNVCWYYIALKAAKNMALTLQVYEDTTWYEDRIESIERNFAKKYWRGTHYGSAGKPREERTSSLALISGLANEGFYKILVDSTLFPVRKSSPHMEWLAEEALMVAGQYDKGLLRMKQRYMDQVTSENLSTLYERFDVNRRGTYNHAWNAPNYVLSRYIAGIKPSAVAWASFEVKPQLVHLTYLKQTVPSVKGDITIEIKQEAHSFAIEVNVPEQTTATVYLPKSPTGISEAWVNGQLAWENETFNDEVEGVKLHDVDLQWLSFEVRPGQWHFIAKR